MSEREPLTDSDGEVRELLADDMARLRPLAQVVPGLAGVLPGREAGAPGRRTLSLRIDEDVLDAYRATGPGWQDRMRETLRKGMPTKDQAEA